MRKSLVNRMTVMVAVGGKVHRGGGLIAGVSEELKLAQKRGAPCFLVRGFGGMVAAVAAKMDLKSFANNLSEAYNSALLSSTDISATVNIIFSHLAHNKALIDRNLTFLD
jgi:ribonucleotide monophosphatase NagD (HAD superfamily)